MSDLLTLDYAQARKRLQAYALPAPHDYVLLLVASGVASGAGQVSVELDKGRLRLSHNGPQVLPRELWPNLFSFPLVVRERERRWATALALGLNGALKVSSRVLVRTASPEGPLQVTITAKDLKVEAGAPGDPAFEVVVERKSSWLPFAKLPEGEALSLRCVHAPIPVTLNGKAVNAPVHWDDCLAMVAFENSDHPQAYDFGGVGVKARSPGELSAVVGVRRKAEKTPLELVVDGISYFHNPLPWSEGIRAVVAASHRVSRTKSGHDLEQDQDYQGLLGLVRERVNEAEEVLVARFETLQVEPREALALIQRFEKAYNRLAPGDRTGYLKVQLKSLEALLGKTHASVYKAMETLADHYHRLADYGLAKPLLNRLAARKAQEYVDKQGDKKKPGKK